MKSNKIKKEGIMATVNYYQILGIPETATVAEITEKIKEKSRLWTQRQNANRIEQQQEAVNNLRLIPQMKDILLNPEKRAAYDKELKSKIYAPQVESKDVDSEDLIQEGWRLIGMGNIHDALYCATKATQAFPNNPEAWLLLGYCEERWGNYSDAIDAMNKAIKLEPNNAEYYYDLGCLFEDHGDNASALKQYQRAATIDPETTVYRASIGSVLVSSGQIEEGVRILEQCIKEEPNNQGYTDLLAICYIEMGYRNWTLVPDGNKHVSPGYYPTKNEHLTEMEKVINEVEKMNISNDVKQGALTEAKNLLEKLKRRFFSGSFLIVGGAIVLAIVAFLLKSVGLGFYFLICAILYYLSCMTPQYKFNRRFISTGEAGGTATNDFLTDSGCLGAIVIILILPIMIIVNFIRNYTK